MNVWMIALARDLNLSSVALLLSYFYFSPLGEIFRARLRQFPALVNCCTIDWFAQWPTEALRSVASRFLQEINDLDCSERVMSRLVRKINLCLFVIVAVCMSLYRILL